VRATTGTIERREEEGEKDRTNAYGSDNIRGAKEIQRRRVKDCYKKGYKGGRRQRQRQVGEK
jgi:hypothetical protein